jgi:hypothetical protein
MRLAKNAFLITLTMLALIVSASAQVARSQDDPRNQAPTVGTGGPVGGPTGLFTVYDGQTLRRGEFTFSVAYSNFDRDPGNVDITETPLSFHIGVTNNLELFFNTDGLRRIKVNSPENLSSFYLPNSRINGVSPGAIVLAPQGAGTTQFIGPVYRPAGTAAFCVYPYTGCSAGNFGFTVLPGNPFQIGQFFGFPVNTNPTLGPPRAGGDAGSLFPGVGSIYGGLLPGVVLTTSPAGTVPGAGGANDPRIYTLQPSYLPDAPFINRTYGETSFNSFVIGAKWRFTSVKNPVGIGIIPFYRFYADNADDASGFNQMQRGAGPGSGGWNPFSSNRGDVGLTFFADVRARKWLNISGNVGYIHNGSIKADIGGTEFTLLDRPDEFQYAVGLDFPVNRYFQPILEFRQTRYVGGRTPNAFENDPMDGLAGVRIFPARWFGFGLAYRHNFNQQDRDSVEGVGFSQNVVGQRTVLNAQNNVVGFTTFSTTSTGSSIIPGFRPSSDPHGFILQFFAGHRDKRGNPDIENKPANVTALDLDRTTIVLPCAPGTKSRSGSCGDNMSAGVRTTAVDPEGDVLTYSYTVSGGRITGQGANVNWDLSGVRPGTYTITSAVDDGCGFCGTPKTTTITVTECPDCAPECSCPSISVTPPSGTTNPGDTMTFTANVSGGSQSSVTYNWSVSNGSIVEGQGTPVIRVSTAGLEDTTITATVDVGGTDPACACPKTASESGIVAGRPKATLATESVGEEKADVLKQRVDQFYTELANNPSATGVIINYGTDKEVQKRQNEIEKAIAFRKYDRSRVTFVRGDSTPGIRTRFFIVPAGADQPTP